MGFNVSIASGQGKKVACDEFKSPLPYAEYGVETPNKESGWSCSVLVFDGMTPDTVSWESGNKQILFGNYDPPPPDTAETQRALHLDPKIPEPLKSLRLYAESFLGDDKFKGRNKFTETSVQSYFDKPKAILFSKNNERIVVYQNNGLMKVSGAERIYQTAEIFRFDKADRLVNVTCKGCTPDEFFSLVINPVIQQ
jgi:hypothetical protein